LEALKGEETTAQIASRWSTPARCAPGRVDGAAGIFGGDLDREKEADQALIAQLYQHIGQLKVEPDFLQDKLGVIVRM
jgi:hypothetical protein